MVISESDVSIDWESYESAEEMFRLLAVAIYFRRWMEELFGRSARQINSLPLFPPLFRSFSLSSEPLDVDTRRSLMDFLSMCTHSMSLVYLDYYCENIRAEIWKTRILYLT